MSCITRRLQLAAKFSGKLWPAALVARSARNNYTPAACLADW